MKMNNQNMNTINQMITVQIIMINSDLMKIIIIITIIMNIMSKKIIMMIILIQLVVMKQKIKIIKELIIELIEMYMDIAMKT